LDDDDRLQPNIQKSSSEIFELDNPIILGSIGNFLRKRNNLNTKNMDKALLGEKYNPSKTLSF